MANLARRIFDQTITIGEVLRHYDMGQVFNCNDGCVVWFDKDTKYEDGKEFTLQKRRTKKAAKTQTNVRR